MRTDRIGEVLLSTIAVDRIKKRYPEARVSFVTSEYAKDIVSGRRDVSEIITVDTMDNKWWLVKAVLLGSSLRKRHFDAAVVLNPHRALHVACFLAGIPERIGYDRKWGFLLNRTIRDERDKGEKHEIEYTMDLLNVMGIDTAAPAPELPVDRETEDFISGFLSRNGIRPDRPLLIIHPGSSNPAKMWPADRYAELITRLRSSLDCQVAVVGDKKEREPAERVVRESKADVYDLSGEFDLKGLAAFLKTSALLITNDTGPMHMAAALGVPVIAIFGRNIPGAGPVRWRPWGEGHVVFHEDPGCAPCYDTACPYDHKCLRAVTVDAVLGAALRILSKRK
ncbi:MAG: lipopolysaccharide heptosyltransferase II [Candidatus Omnitrophica bacterium]|nr:lipopolysaccharide heptosyltransferase II [Candidatus Omnitrophota bacterium]